MDWNGSLTPAEIRGWAIDLRMERDCGAQAALLDSIADDLDARDAENDALVLEIAALRNDLDARDARIAGIEHILADPDAVHINMLRGTIARPSIEQVRHLYPEEFAALEAEREKLREALTEAADELDAYYTAEYPTGHPHHVRKLATAKSANPARAALQEPTDAPE